MTIKANNNKNICNNKSKVYAWVQFYDDDGNYMEKFIEDTQPSQVPPEVAESIATNHDITLYVAPGDFVGVFSKNPWDIIEYVNGFYGKAGLKEMLGEYTEDEQIMVTVTRLTKVSGRSISAT